MVGQEFLEVVDERGGVFLGLGLGTGGLFLSLLLLFVL